MREKDLENQLIVAIKDRGGINYKFTSPGHVGVPDRIILFPGAKMGFVEVKSPGKGRLSKMQECEISKLRSFGFPVFILNDPSQIPDIIDEVLGEI